MATGRSHESPGGASLAALSASAVAGRAIASLHSAPLPAALTRALVPRLSRAHSRQPFSAIDPRETVRRVRRIVASAGLEAIVYRGAVDVRGAEADHVWLVVQQAEEDPGWVVDAAFPLFTVPFADALRRFVAGDASAEELATAAAAAGLDDRVLGVFPAWSRYLGRPVWSG